jgi:ribonuclease J
VERPGYTPSERAVIPRLDEVFSQTRKKLFFSCFSSSIYRIRIAMELARKHGRKVAVVGRSMMESTEIAQDLGYIDVPPGLVINPGQIARLSSRADDDSDQRHAGRADERAEPRRGRQPQARAHRAGDTVVLSSRIIPGNEKKIFRVIDHLSRREANVIYDDGQQRADSRERPRQPGGDAAAHQPGAAQVLHPHSRRLPFPAASMPSWPWRPARWSTPW